MIIKTTLLDTQSSKNKSWSKQVLNSMIFSETMKDNSTLNKVFSMRKWHYTQSNNSQYNYVYRCDWRIWATKSSRQTILRVSMRKKTSKSNWIKGNLVLWYSSYLIVVYIMLLEGEEDNISVLWPVATMPASLSQPFALRLNDRQFLCNDKIFSIIDGGIVSFFLHVCYMYHGVKFTNFFHRTWSCQ